MKTCVIDEITLSFADRGSGTALLLVHGFPLDHTMWNGQIERLSARYRVIAPDLRGFGQSGVSDGVVTMERFAGDLAVLIDFLAVREPVVLCGLSMGGYIALEFWRKYAGRLRGLILCDTRAAGDTPEASAGRVALAQRVTSEGAQRVAEMMIPKLFAPATLQNRPDLAESIRQVIGRTDPHGIAAAARGMAQRADFTAELSRIRCPVLLIAGENDVVTPVAEMQNIAQTIPNAEFNTIPNAGHMSPLEQPEAVNAAIEGFLRGI